MLLTQVARQADILISYHPFSLLYRGWMAIILIETRRALQGLRRSIALDRLEIQRNRPRSRVRGRFLSSAALILIYKDERADYNAHPKGVVDASHINDGNDGSGGCAFGRDRVRAGA